MYFTQHNFRNNNFSNFFFYFLLVKGKEILIVQLSDTFLSY